MGGTEFLVDGRGFMHSHGSSLLDIRLSQKDQALVLSDGRAQRHRAGVHHKEGWVSFKIQNENDLEGAKALAQLAYDYARIEPFLTESKQNKI